MPGFDGTGPQGQGPMTGRGEGYCAMGIPQSGEPSYGYAGLQGTPVRLGTPAAPSARGGRFARWLRPATWLGRVFGRGRGHPPAYGPGRPWWGIGRGFWRRGGRSKGRGQGRGWW
jgi:hypothetical protein